MGSNVITGEYMRDNQKFADLCNFFLYKGNQVVKPEHLVEKDVTELGSPYTEKGVQQIEKIRDILKSCIVKSANGITYLIIGVENQSNIHYAMVVRNMVLDALNYEAQVKAIAKKHQEDKDLHGSAEYLSGFKKTDKLLPVITITLYWNSGKWDAPRNLHDMLNVTDEEILQYVPNYNLNLLVPDEIEDFEGFQSDLGVVLRMFQCTNDKSKLKKLIDGEVELIIGKEAATLLSECLSMKIDVLQEKEGGKMDVRNAIHDLIAEGKAEGKAEGRLEELIFFYNQGVITKELAASRMGVKVEEFEKQLTEVNK